MGPWGLLITSYGGLHVHSLFMPFSPFIQHLYTCHLINVKPTPFPSKTAIAIDFFPSFLDSNEAAMTLFLPLLMHHTHICLHKTSFTERECCEILPAGLWTSHLSFKPGFTRHTSSINVFHATLLYLNTDGIKSLKDYNSDFYWQGKTDVIFKYRT